MDKEKKPARKKKTDEGRMPGDPTREEMISSMIRVDHAGEHHDEDRAEDPLRPVDDPADIHRCRENGNGEADDR